MARQWGGWLKEAEIENFHWHDLRHTFASRLVTRGVDIYTVAKLLGHQNIEMTERYAHLDPDYLKHSVEFLVEQPSKQPLASVSA